ncbi:DUF4260 domain-containing protein [Bradyrhizobium prioriisuperbiae]|uniref:DUF4260 domain-containing protein n=1 Tax=Bradyrhizobium prioriisuperbiae TaxID=2854389 RepID=UPI0028E3A941|nr:DUF4260 domain-containing protein [Bradyrhizobium prioritasuperba]
MTVSKDQPPGGVTGVPKLLLQLEGLALIGAAVTLYAHSGASWWLFAVLALAPDLSLLGYLAGPRVGTVAYNTFHTTLVPIVLGAASLALLGPLALHLALIWLAHIGLDRALGYGLKYDAGFGFTHLGRIGKQAAIEPQP